MPRAYPSWITGLEYRSPDGTDRRAYCASLNVGDVLKLRPEPTNPYDPKAVAIYHSGRHIGYVPRKHHWVRESLREGDTLECSVRDVSCSSKGRADYVLIQIAVLADGDIDPDSYDGAASTNDDLRNATAYAGSADAAAHAPVEARPPGLGSCRAGWRQRFGLHIGADKKSASLAGLCLGDRFGCDLGRLGGLADANPQFARQCAGGRKGRAVPRGAATSDATPARRSP